MLSLVERSPTGCVSVICNIDTSTMRRRRPGVLWHHRRKNKTFTTPDFTVMTLIPKRDSGISFTPDVMIVTINLGTQSLVGVYRMRHVKVKFVLWQKTLLGSFSAFTF